MRSPRPPPLHNQPPPPLPLHKQPPPLLLLQRLADSAVLPASANAAYLMPHQAIMTRPATRPTCPNLSGSTMHPLHQAQAGSSPGLGTSQAPARPASSTSTRQLLHAEQHCLLLPPLISSCANKRPATLLHAPESCGGLHHTCRQCVAVCEGVYLHVTLLQNFHVMTPQRATFGHIWPQLATSMLRPPKGPHSATSGLSAPICRGRELNLCPMHYFWLAVPA